MREFTNKSLWDKENQEWVDLFYIDGQECNHETYCEQLEIEELATEDESNVCEECSQCEGCDEHCGRGNHDEVVEENECDCPICEAERYVQEQECFCENCNRDLEKDLLDECFEYIFGNACPDCIIEKVLETVYSFKEIGRQSVKQEVRDYLED
jgi:hypothetical protein